MQKFLFLYHFTLRAFFCSPESGIFRDLILVRKVEIRGEVRNLRPKGQMAVVVDEDRVEAVAEEGRRHPEWDLVRRQVVAREQQRVAVVSAERVELGSGNALDMRKRRQEEEEEEEEREE